MKKKKKERSEREEQENPKQKVESEKKLITGGTTIKGGIGYVHVKMWHLRKETDALPGQGSWRG